MTTILDIYSTVACEALGRPLVVMEPILRSVFAAHGWELCVQVPDAEVDRLLAELRGDKLALVLWLGQWAETADKTMTPADKAQLRLLIQARQN